MQNNTYKNKEWIKEILIIKNNQAEILELKNSVNEMKNTIKQHQYQNSKQKKE